MKYRLSWVLPFLAILFFTLPACKKDSGTTGQASLGSSTGSAGGVRWTVPKRWANQPERPMRIATYAIPAAEGDAEGAECAVSFFGASQGGNVDANIDRWLGQFESVDVPSRSSREINGTKVTTVQIAGAYLSPGGPMMMSTGKKENFRLLGAIIEAPEGLVFFKLTGPSKTVGSINPEFDAMVGSLSK
jgi:hypothetical protein